MSAAWRMSRACFAGVLATSVALILHSHAGGSGSLLAVVVSFAGVVWLAVLLAGRRLGAFSLTALVAAAQLYVHGVMAVLGMWRVELTGSGALSMTVGAHGAPGGADMAGMSAGGAEMGSAGMTGMSHAVAGPGMAGSGLLAPGMLVAHAFALVATVVALYWGESALASLTSLFSRMALRLLCFIRPIFHPWHATAWPSAPVRSARRILSTPRVLRGPPCPEI